MQYLASYQRRIILMILVVILSGLILKFVDRQRRAVGFDVRGFLDGYKYTTTVDTTNKAVTLSTNAFKTSGEDVAGEISTKPYELKVCINTADELELQKLPGVGPVLAKRIIEHRDSAGHFADFEEIKEVDGIGEKKLLKMKEYLTF